MRYHTRQKIKRGCKLAGERLGYYIFPQLLDRIRFLRYRINWSVVANNSRDTESLIKYSRAGKFTDIQYLLKDSDLNWYAQKDPFDSHDKVLIEANDICNHRINILGVGRVSYSSKIDWHCDPYSGERFPSNWFSSRPSDDIDGRFLTELNLHRHFPVLAMAWLISGERRYADELVKQLLDWIRKNPPVSDAFISDGLELAAKVFCWSHCLYILREFPIKTNDYLEILRRIETYGTLIDSQYDEAGTQNNHQIAEAFGLYFIGTMYPELKDANCWRKKGLALLTDNLSYQFLDGGVHAEQSVSYHMFVLECYLITILLSQVNSINLSDDYYKTISKAAEFLYYLQKPSGKSPMLGDAAFRFFCPTGDASYDASVFIAVAGTVVDKKEFLNTQSNRLEEVFWLVGRERFRDCIGNSKITSAHGTKVFPDSGHIIVNSSQGKLSQYLYFKCGPQGLGRTAGHGHDDVLNIEYSALGDEFLVDPGTYTYSLINPLRRYFMGARAHNTVLVDGKGATQPSDGAFGWKKTVNGELIEVASANDVVWIRGQHNGYEASQGRLVVERALLLVHDCYVLMIDRVSGKGRHQVENLFHFHPDIKVRIDQNVVEAIGQQGRLFVLTSSSATTRKSLHRGADDEQPGWYSAQYGKIQPSSTLRITSSAQLPFWRITGLFPAELDDSQSPPELSIGRKPEKTTSDAQVLNIAVKSGDMVDSITMNWGKKHLQETVDFDGTMSLLRESGNNNVLYVCPRMQDSESTYEKLSPNVNVLKWLYCNSDST